MAKLNVVIPAVEVTVDGVAYRKVDRKAQAGDIVKALKRDTDITEGEFYGPLRGVLGNLGFDDNVSDFRYSLMRDRQSQFEVYAPISEPATTTASDTVTFEGATWRKVDRDVREGDAIKFTDEARSSYLTEAELYVVNYVDSCDDPQITDDDGDDYDAGGEDYEVYEKVAEEKAVEYREVKRKANVGERIKIVAAEQSGGLYEDGEEYVVTDENRWNNGRAVSVRGVNNAIYHREYVVLEPVTKSAEPTIPERLAVGDYARVVERGHHAFNYGDIVEIIGTDDSSVPYHAKALTNGNSGWASASRLVRATDEEVAAAKDPRSQFAAGDKVRLISGGGKFPLKGYDNGGIYTVVIPKQDGGRYPSVQITGGVQNEAFAKADQLIKLTAAEIAEIERKQAEEAAKCAEEAKWAAIGRKVNEFKRGDIVEGKRRLGGGGEIIRGEIEVIDGVSDQSAGILSYADGKFRSVDILKLIVPVEQRFDREVNAA